MTINIPRERFIAEYRALRARGAGAGIELDAGFARVSEGIQLLVSPRNARDPPRPRALWFQVTSNLAEESAASVSEHEADAVLFIGQGRDFGRARGLFRLDAGEIRPVNELLLPGPGMHRFALGANAIDPPMADETWSRVQGALGLSTWRRLTALRFALVAAGRMGGSIGTILVHEGVRRFVLIDSDTFKPHNLAGGLAGAASDASKPKVRILARALREIRPDAEVEELPTSVTHLRAAGAIADSDFVICSADHDSARLAAAILAALYNKPLLDVGVGIFRNGERREMGGDIRLVWPGRCLLCAGGLRAEPEARRVLGSAEAEDRVSESRRDWRLDRAGSLSSVAAAVAGVAVRVVEDFVDERVAQNGFWTRIEFDPHGRLRVSYPEAAAEQRMCCCRLGGLGDDGLDRIDQFLSELELSRDT